MSKNLMTLRAALIVIMIFTATASPSGSPARAQSSACSPVTSTITAPFSFDGAGTFCWQASNLGGFINSWNLASLTVNGVVFTNRWAGSGEYPPPINGFWYVSYTSNFPWGHFEAAGTGGTPVPTATRTNTSVPTRTNTPGGPTNTPTRTPTRTNTPGGPANTPTRTPTRTNTPPGGFLDNLDSYNTSLWTKADGWTNGNPFNVGWRADHINFSGGIMTLTLDNQTCPSGCSNRPYASGEYRRNVLTGYGLYEARFKAAKASGIVSSLFTYTGASDGQPWDEIDIEILGKDTTRMQTNYFTNGVGGHETLINLGFDASLGFHTYGIEYRATRINWYVDGVLVHTENGSRGPLPSHNMKLMMNLWPGIGVDSWLGPFTYTGPLRQQVDWVKYTP
jgi:endo-1,3-1,4-beta-glycanase ExoK